MIELDTNYKYQKITSNYGEIEQRWLIIHSKKAYRRELKSLNKKMLKLSQSESKQFSKLCNQEFVCIPDALKALLLFKKSCKYIA